MRKIIMLLVIAVGITFALGYLVGATRNLAETEGEVSKALIVASEPVPGPTPFPPLQSRRWYLSGDRVMGVGPCTEVRRMYTEPKNTSYVFMSVGMRVIWIADNSSGWYSAGRWTGHIEWMSGYEFVVSIGVFDNKTKKFKSYGSTTIPEGSEYNFTIYTPRFFVGDDQYLAFCVFNPSPWLKIVTSECYIDKRPRIINTGEWICKCI